MTSQKKQAAANRPPNAVESKATTDTFPKLLLQNAKQRGDRPAIREKSRGIWRTMTWRELADEVAALASALSAQGLKRGSHVVLVGDNRPRLYAAMCAAHALGAVAVPLYQDMAADEMVSPINTVEATHVFAENQEQVDKLLELLPKCPSVVCVVYDEDRGMRHYKQKQLMSYAALVKQGRQFVSQRLEFLPTEAARGSGEDAAFVFFTSGTTGPARGVVLTHGALIGSARVAAEIEGLKDTDIALAYLPPGWIAQNLFAYVQPMVVGYCVCCPESSETMVTDMREIGPTVFLAPPRVLDALLTQVSMRIEGAGAVSRFLYSRFMKVAERVVRRDLAGAKVSPLDRLAHLLGNPLIYGPLRDVLGMGRIRVAYTAGDSTDPDLLIFFRALGVNLKQLYGSTETGFLVAMHRNADVKLNTVGKPLHGVEIKLSPEREILVRSPGLFREYHKDPTATARARGADGWLHTGDLGSLDDNGHLRVVDSLTNLGTLTGGTQFAPRPIENRLKFFPYIKEAVVFGHGRDAVCALIDIDITAVGRWADKKSIAYTGYADLAAHDEVYELIGGCISTVNADLAGDAELATAQIHRFVVLPKELSSDDGVLTRTGKLQRAAIAGRFGRLMNAMYETRNQVPFDVDGPGPDADVLKIGDAKISAAAKPRKAA
jgi:long-chain acyl-CoA synthetase